MNKKRLIFVTLTGILWGISGLLYLSNNNLFINQIYTFFHNFTPYSLVIELLSLIPVLVLYHIILRLDIHIYSTSPFTRILVYSLSSLVGITLVYLLQMIAQTAFNGLRRVKQVKF